MVKRYYLLGLAILSCLGAIVTFPAIYVGFPLPVVFFVLAVVCTVMWFDRRARQQAGAGQEEEPPYPPIRTK